jgi:hypothetical protein
LTTHHNVLVDKLARAFEVTADTADGRGKVDNDLGAVCIHEPVDLNLPCQVKLESPWTEDLLTADRAQASNDMASQEPASAGDKDPLLAKLHVVSSGVASLKRETHIFI